MHEQIICSSGQQLTRWSKHDNTVLFSLSCRNMHLK